MDLTSKGEFALDHQRRIAKRKATWEHAHRALAYFDEQRDDDGYQQLEEEMALLEPYWNRPGVTKEQAVAAYFDDHPDDAVRSFEKRHAELGERVKQLQTDLDRLNERRAARGLPPFELDLSLTP
jgi:hypothetical protein